MTAMKRTFANRGGLPWWYWRRLANKDARYYAPSPAPDGYHWEFVTLNGVRVTSGGDPVVSLVEN